MRHVTLRQQAYAKIKDMLISGQIQAGTSLSETQLAKDLGMSRTPIREAIRQMEMEGIVEYSPRFSVVVKSASGSMVEEMFGVREALEAHASAEAAESISSGDLRKLQSLYDSMNSIADKFEASGEQFLQEDELRKFNNADMAFHSVIVEASGNEYLSKLVKDTKILTRIFTSSIWKYDVEALREANQFHKQLLDALRAGDGDAARQSTMDAMQVAKANVLEHLVEADSDSELYGH